MIPLEDNVGDIIGKAQRGLRISDTELAEKARVSSQKIRKLRDGEFEVVGSKLQRSDGIYRVSGTASMGRVLNLKLIREGGHGFSVTGPLNDPHVVAATLPDTQAALKP